MRYSKKKASTHLIRQINRASVIEIIKEEGPISRSEIARKLEFNKVTVSSIIRNLLEENIIREKSAQTSSRGVKPILYYLNRDDNLFGAISIDATITSIAIVNIESKIIAREDLPTQKETSEDFLNYCIDSLDRLKKRINHKELVGVGVSIPGTLDFQKTELIHSINLNWHHVPLLKIFKNRVKEPVSFENDTRCASLAEWYFSPNQAIRDADIFIFIKSGVACNVKFNDQLFTGQHNLACEFGHLIIDSVDDTDDSKRVGYLKNYISDKEIVKYYHQLTKETTNGDIDQEIEWILRQFQMQQPEAIQTIKRFTKYLAIGLANLINLLDPNGIIIHSKVTKIWNDIYNDLMAETLKYTIHQEEKHFSLYPSSLNDDATVIGAATLIIRQFLKTSNL